MALIKSVRGFTPEFGENCFLADNATIIGDVKMGQNCSIWFSTVLRGDVNSIRMGDGVNIQDGSVLHTLYEKSTIEIGNYVSVGHNVTIHGATVKDYDQQIYLNHKLIEEKQLNLADIQEKAAEFLIQFSGVNEVYSGKRLLLGSWTPDISMIRNSFHRKRSGDLLIDVLPGWSIVNENTSDHKVVRKAHIPSPLIFMGSGVKPAVINTPVTIDHIAPTVAHILRIRSPNACSATPITDIR